MIYLQQTIPQIEGAPWWVILIAFVVAPALWKAVTWWTTRSDDRRSEYKRLITEKDEQIAGLNSRLLQETIEARDVSTTITHTLEHFLREQEELKRELQEMFDKQRKLHAMIEDLHERSN